MHATISFCNLYEIPENPPFPHTTPSPFPQTVTIFVPDSLNICTRALTKFVHAIFAENNVVVSSGLIYTKYPKSWDQIPSSTLWKGGSCIYAWCTNRHCNCRDDCNCIDHEAHFSWQPMNCQLSNIFVAIRLFSWFAEDEYKAFVEYLNWILNSVYLSTCVIEFLWYLDWLPCKEISARNGKSGEALKDPIAHSVPPPSWNVTKRGCKKGGVQIA